MHDYSPAPARGPRAARRGRLEPPVAFLLLVTLGLVGWVSWLTLEMADSGGPGGVGAVRSVTPRDDLTPSEQTTIDIFERAAPGVVNITTLDLIRQRRLFGSDVRRVATGSGSGFVWDTRGHVVTNFHVIADAEEAIVTMADGSEWPARLVGGAPDYDLAVLRIEAPVERLRPIAVGTSRDLRVGQRTVAIGNPFGLDHTLTTGVISALDREMESLTGRTIYGVVQTDAAINPGNSGGPLLDSAGRLIGINAAIKSPSGAYAGIGFAIPVDIVRRVVPQLVRYGRAARPGLGLLLLGDHMAERLGVRGAAIRRVFPGSAAQAAGLVPLEVDPRGRLRLGDVIVALDDQPVATASDLARLIDPHDVGDVLVLEVDRDGARRHVQVTLEAIE